VIVLRWCRNELVRLRTTAWIKHNNYNTYIYVIFLSDPLRLVAMGSNDGSNEREHIQLLLDLIFTSLYHGGIGFRTAKRTIEYSRDISDQGINNSH
jgi:hypothetical protein